MPCYEFDEDAYLARRAREQSRINRPDDESWRDKVEREAEPDTYDSDERQWRERDEADQEDDDAER